MSKKNSYIRSRYLHFFRVALVVLVLLLGLFFLPVNAQSNATKEFASVTIDGRELFKVSRNEKFNLTAQKRAQDVIEELQRVANSQNKPVVEVETFKNLPTIAINNRYLLTVTSKDTVADNTPEEQAQIWANKITDAIEKAQKERSAEFIRKTSILSILILIGTFFLHQILGILWKKTQKQCSQILTANDSSASNYIQTLNFLLKTILLFARITLWVGVILYITNLFPLTRQWSYNIAKTIVASLTSPILQPGQNSYSVIDILILVGLFLGLFIIAGAIANLLRSRVLRIIHISVGVEEVIAVVFKYALIGIGSVILLQVWGVDLSSLAILASALGVGIGFGFQDIAKNFGSGLVLLFERPIQAGDFIQIGEYMGTVEHIGARSVVIRTLDRISIIVPNSRFLETEVINWSHKNPVSRIHLPVGVAYGSDVNKVKTALLEAAREHKNILQTPQPHVFFKGFGDSSLNFELLIWINQPSHQMDIKSELYFLIEAALARYHIEIPFPQQDLHVRSGNLPIKLSPQLEKALLHISELLNGKISNN
ncbi:MAG: mechanosensitive ion channel [Nostocaceae cyanobacterium]|nr:mechanosensitive ion channel [Nostocaceae cyanobacterium]